MASKPSVINLAALDKEELALQAQLAAIKQKRETAAAEQANKVGEVIASFPNQLKKILGREVSFADMINLIKQKEKGTLGHVADTIDRTKRLTDEQKTNLRAALMTRAINLKTSQAAEQMSAIAARFGVTAQTVDNYKPTAEQVQAELDKLTAPATEAAPAS